MSSYRPIRVLMLSADGLDGRGGIARSAAYLVDALAGHDDLAVGFLRSRLSEGRLAKHLTVPIALARFTARLASTDIVHIHVAPRGSTWRKRIYAAVARAAGRQVVLHLHGSGYDQFFAGLAPARQRQVRQMFWSADAMVTLSSYWEAFALDTLGVPRDRVVQIANGVPEPGGAFAKPAADPPVILFLGAIGPRKGTDVLIEALRLLAARGIAWQAVIAGDGEVAAAREQAERAGIADHIRFPGWVGPAEVDQLIRSSHLLTLPSRAENQPVAILEAMARATPVVASAIGAIPEQIEDGVSGLLVPPGDAPALAEALAALLGDAGRRESMGAAARQRFEQQFAIGATSARFADLYRSLRQRRDR